MIKFKRIGMLGALASGVVLAGCATVEEAVVQKTAETYHATLTGAQEVGGGDADGYATAQVSVADRADQICYDINDIRNLSDIIAIHVHRGAPGVDGPPVWTLAKANEGGWKGCTDKAEWMQDAFENRFRNYYVNVHTTEYPNGAIRGQLGD